MIEFSLISDDCFNFLFFFPINEIGQWSEEIGAVFHCFLISGKKRGMEDWVDLPSSTSKGPIHFIWSFLSPPIWRFVVSSYILSLTFHGENLDEICSFIFC